MTTKIFAWVAFLTLFLLHQWRPVVGDELILGWLPGDMAYRIAWMGLAWAYLIWFTTAVWKGEGES